MINHHYGTETIIAKKNIVELISEERSDLKAIISTDRIVAYKRKHAQILLKIDQSSHGPRWIDKKSADAFDCNSMF